MAFDESFLTNRKIKEKSWASAGIRTGSGGLFSESTKSISMGQDWGREASKSERKRQQSIKGLSPHAVALAALAKNPSLRTGGVDTRTGKKISASHEHWEQVMIFDWIYRYLPDYYIDFAAIPNGGLRAGKTARDLKAEGQCSGYPDIVGDIPSGCYHGLFIELKYGSNKVSSEQIEKLNRKYSRGYFACVCYGFEEAKEVITEYLALGANDSMVWSKNTEQWLIVA